MAIQIYAESGKPIHIGRMGENLATEVIFNIEEQITSIGADGTFSLLILQNDELTEINLAQIDNSHIKWDIISDYTPKKGKGKCQIVYKKEANLISKSCIYDLEVTLGFIGKLTTKQLSTVLGNYILVGTDNFNSTSARSFFQNLVGKGVDNTKTTTNYYSKSNTTTSFTYDLIFENVPSNAIIKSLYCEINGHAESTASAQEFLCVQLVSNEVNLSEEINFKAIGTANTTITLEATTLPTISQLQDLKLKCKLGYYGGAINGATCYLTYEYYA